MVYILVQMFIFYTQKLQLGKYSPLLYPKNNKKDFYKIHVIKANKEFGIRTDMPVLVGNNPSNNLFYSHTVDSLLC